MVGGLKLYLYGICQLSLVIFGSCGIDVGNLCTDALGNEGICKKIADCPAAVEGIKGQITPITCSFDGQTPIVCCPKAVGTTLIVSSPITPTTSAMKPGDKAKHWCSVYSSYCPTSLVRGDFANINEFPHMAAVGRGEKESIEWVCNGVLISEKFVLTAAHCVLLRNGGQIKWVLLGTEDIQRTTEQASPNARRGQTHPVVRWIPHPEFRLPSKYNDIALLEIGPSLEPNALELTTQELHPACLPIDLAKSPKKVISTGWGRINFDEVVSTDLLKMEVKIVDSTICNETYNSEEINYKLSRGIDKTMICALVLEKGKDICRSGGPIQVPIKENCLYEILGISSFGKFCGFNSPSVYTRVSEYIPWIESIVWP